MKRILRKVEYEQLRGLEITIMNSGRFIRRGDDTVEEIREKLGVVEFRYHSLRDFLHFECYLPYAKEMGATLGRWRFLYVMIIDPMRASLFFYIAPLGWLILFGRFMRRMWMVPARFFYEKGMLDVDAGSIVPLFWFVRLRFRGKGHSRE